jgi:hypothetical protein
MPGPDIGDPGKRQHHSVSGRLAHSHVTRLNGTAGSIAHMGSIWLGIFSDSFASVRFDRKAEQWEVSCISQAN